MVFTSPTEAMQFYADNLDWENDINQAKNALQALRYLKVNRPVNSSHVGSSLSFAEIDTTIKRIEDIISMTNRVTWTTPRNRFL